MLSNLPRINRIASFAILPMMTLAIVVFSRFADDGGSSSEPPTGGVLVVANLRTESISFIDIESGQRRDATVPGPPHEMLAVDGRLYITLGRADALVELDLASGAILRVLPLEGEPHGIAAWGGNIIVTLDKANAAVVIDRATLTELRRYPTGETPHVVAVSRSSILVTDSRDNQVRRLEPDPRTTATGGQPEGIAIVGEHVITADAAGGTVTIARAADLSGAQTMAVGQLPVRVAAFDDGTALVALQGQGEVAVVDVASGRIERRFDTVARPDGLCVSPAREFFGVASNGEGRLQVFSSADWKPVSAFQLEAGLGSCLWLDGR